MSLGLWNSSHEPWETTIAEKYQANAIVKGYVTKMTIFGFFFEL